MPFTIEMGPPPHRQYVEDREQYARGYALANAKRYMLTPQEQRRQVTEPCNDSFTEGWQDCLGGKPNRYEQ